ncbi:DUF3486 family protein [Vibrio harveyi]|uniref:DUF3486 family protein n=1 Tax=Vibrio harveyi TaxID=669 RepID=UPI003BB6608A
MSRKKLQRSKIDLLPKDIKDQLNLWLRGGSMTQQDALDALRELIDKAGLPEDAKPSYTALNRYTRRMDEMGARVREAREVAEVWAHKLGEAPVSEVGKLLQEFVRTMAFETSAHMMESEDPIPPKALGQLALVIQRVEQAAMASHKVEKEIRAAFAAEAANAVSDELRGADGMSEQLEDRIRGILLGKA